MNQDLFNHLPFMDEADNFHQVLPFDQGRGPGGRADDITKVKGVLLSPSAIEEVARGVSGLGNEYEVVVEKKGDTDRITLKVEFLPDVQSQQAEIEKELTDQLRLKTNLRYDLQFYAMGELPRYEVKAQRFKDLRK